MIRHIALFPLGFVVAATAGCFRLQPSDGGGQTDFSPPRQVAAADVAVPPGYRVEVVATGFTFPTGVAVDEAGVPHVVEAGYSYGEVWTTPRLLRVNPDGSTTEIARGGKNGPWNGVAYSRGDFYIAEGGELEGGRILRVSRDGRVTALVENLPSLGDHHTNGPAVGPDGRIYFGQGTATNSAVVGPDNAAFGWLERYPDFHDTPCRDVTLVGRNFESRDVVNEGVGRKVSTGAYSPFAEPTMPGQVIPGRLPCNGAVMRVDPDGGGLALVAWGFRNPFGLAFSPKGELFVTENGYDVRGSRPVWGTGDHLWRVREGAWYGWPDFSGGAPLDRPVFEPPGESAPGMVLQSHPGTPPKPVATLGVHASANGIDFSRSARFGHVGEAFIAEFGDQAPVVGKTLSPVGFRVVRVDVDSGRITDFMTNEGPKHGPASKIGTAGLERPVALRFDPSGEVLYVVDFGVMLMDEKGARPIRGTGVLWKVSREEAR